jgi:hypothetical protein
MFGFGMSAEDKWHLEQAEVMTEPYVIFTGQKEAKKLAREMFDSAKAELAPKYGNAMYAEDIGDKLIATQKDFVEKRLTAGLSLEDIRNYWNQTFLMRELWFRFLEMPIALELERLRKMGKSQNEIENAMDKWAHDWRKTDPRWGEPDQWKPDFPANKGYSSEDADIYIEFLMRVMRWQAKTTITEQQTLLKNYSSYNAMLRDLISKGSI